jgi:hypothetical protein
MQQLDPFPPPDTVFDGDYEVVPLIEDQPNAGGALNAAGLISASY